MLLFTLIDINHFKQKRLPQYFIIIILLIRIIGLSFISVFCDELHFSKETR